MAAQLVRPLKIQAKLQEASDNHAVSGRLQRTRTALRQLKTDVKSMDVLIGAKSATLLAKQLAAQRMGEKRSRIEHTDMGWRGVSLRGRYLQIHQCARARSSALMNRREKRATPQMQRLSVLGTPQQLGRDDGIRRNFVEKSTYHWTMQLALTFRSDN